MWKIFRKKTQDEKELEDLSKKIKSEPLNMSQLFSNLNMRVEIDSLYTDLCRRSHPDRFVGDEKKMALADKLFKQVQESKADYKKLLELKDDVDKLCENENQLQR
jgi:hypothetical protein